MNKNHLRVYSLYCFTGKTDKYLIGTYFGVDSRAEFGEGLGLEVESRGLSHILGRKRIHQDLQSLGRDPCR